MADYIEYNFELEPREPWCDILQSELADIGFESFVDTEKGVQAFVQEGLVSDELINSLDTLNNPICEIKYSSIKIESKNWNEEWEKNFQAIEVDERCVIRAPFHREYKAEYEIVIEPKMSFGTGHHQTTHMLVSYLLEMENLKDAKVMDMGCGTGILAILTAMRGASVVDAVDVDEWAYENTLENCQRNGVDFISVYHGDASSLKGNENYDLFIANINRNILVNDMDKYSKSMKVGAEILFSGFYVQDNEIIVSNAEKHGFKLVEEKTKDNWSALKMQKVN